MRTSPLAYDWTQDRTPRTPARRWERRYAQSTRPLRGSPQWSYRRLRRAYDKRLRAVLQTVNVGGGSGGGTSIRIGIPNVPSGLEVDTALPTLPSPWNTSTAGFYYVKQGGGAGDNGTPAAPRGTIPNPIPAGAVVVVDNTATLSATTFTLNFSGSSGSRAWVIGSGQVGLGSGSAKAILAHTGGAAVIGTYGYVDGIEFSASATGDLVAFGASGNTLQNTLIRHVALHSTGAQRSNNNGNSMGGTSTSVRTSNVVLYDVAVYDHGAWDPVSLPSDIDVHGLQLNEWIEDIWILDSQFYHNQGDGIQLTGAGPNGLTTHGRRIYVHGCSFYENLQAGIWWKFGTIIIVSQCTIHSQNLRAGAGAGTGDPIGIGGQYDFGEVWILFCRIYDCDNSIRFASYSNTQNSVIYIIGCIVTNTKASSGIQTGSPNSEGCAIGFWQGSANSCFVIHCTIWKFTGHGIAATPGSANGLVVENTIIAGRTNASCFDLIMESYSIAPKVRNCSWPAAPRFAMNSTTLTQSSVSAFESADSTNRANSLSGSVSFVNAVDGVGDFHVNAGDPTIGAGLVTTNVYNTYQTSYGLNILYDFAGNARPISTTYDIGAYEQ